MSSRGRAFFPKRRGKRPVILASVADDVALSLPQRLSRPDVLVVTPADLSRPGWNYRPGQSESQIVVDGEVFGTDEIAGVVTRLPRISDCELLHIAPAERAYVAAEVGAFLLAWLSELDRPVLNRPGPNCLCGPFWRHERWVAEAARAGLDVQPARRSVGLEGTCYLPPPCVDRLTVTVVGDRCFGKADETLLNQARWLARSTRTETLTVHFSDTGTGMRFFTANPWPCLEVDEVARAVLDHLGASMGIRS